MSDLLPFWKSVSELDLSKESYYLIFVAQSEGSSPGRQGFKMLVGPESLEGSIGGGIMEQKWVGWLRSDQPELTEPILKHQHHHPHPDDRSGLICSGTQSLIFIKLDSQWQEELRQLNFTEASGIRIDRKGLQHINYESEDNCQFSLEADQWEYSERICQSSRIHIVGGGHVGLACSGVLKMLGYQVVVYDNRALVNTFVQNDFADRKVVCDYDKIGSLIPEGPEEYVIIMTFGFQSDAQVLRGLISKEFAYLGMMGSRTKVNKLFDDLLAEGYSETSLEKVSAPIGLQIKSRTPEEIAISIAAEIIQLRNKNLP